MVTLHTKQGKIPGNLNRCNYRNFWSDGSQCFPRKLIAISWSSLHGCFVKTSDAIRLFEFTNLRSIRFYLGRMLKLSLTTFIVLSARSFRTTGHAANYKGWNFKSGARVDHLRLGSQWTEAFFWQEFRNVYSQAWTAWCGFKLCTSYTACYHTPCKHFCRFIKYSNACSWSYLIITLNFLNRLSF